MIYISLLFGVLLILLIVLMIYNIFKLLKLSTLGYKFKLMDTYIKKEMKRTKIELILYFIGIISILIVIINLKN